MLVFSFFFFQAEDGIRDAQESRGLGDVYKRQVYHAHRLFIAVGDLGHAGVAAVEPPPVRVDLVADCLLYTSDAADDLLCVDLGGRRIIKKKKK